VRALAARRGRRGADPAARPARRWSAARLRRCGAIPLPLRAVLFGPGPVHGRDDAAHAHRKSLFVGVLEPAAVERLTAAAEAGWAAAAAWPAGAVRHGGAGDRRRRVAVGRDRARAGGRRPAGSAAGRGGGRVRRSGSRRWAPTGGHSSWPWWTGSAPRSVPAPGSGPPRRHGPDADPPARRRTARTAVSARRHRSGAPPTRSGEAAGGVAWTGRAAGHGRRGSSPSWSRRTRPRAAAGPGRADHPARAGLPDHRRRRRHGHPGHRRRSLRVVAR
jgi:hypothetical protein